MTRTEQDRRKRQMNRRIREVMAVRRGLAASNQYRSDAPDHKREPVNADRPASGQR